MHAKHIFIVFSLVIILAGYPLYLLWAPIIWSALIFGPIILLGYYDIFQSKHAIRRNYPVIGHLRYLLEGIRPEIQQYFIETDIEGRPVSRIIRSLIYQRAKNVNDTEPFGTQLNVYKAGYEWMEHSIYAKSRHELTDTARVLVGGPDCQQPYSSSILNISAMSFGALSKNAIMALNSGAKIGGFSHNTGEGGLSPFHLKYGGDLVWQIGTAYFGCRTKQGNFDPDAFQNKVSKDNIKMIEIKISQGAKPGHGGILPAGKNTVEIASMRSVEPHVDVISPPAHSAFTNAEELMTFIKQLRHLSGGKPIGFKLCIGRKQEFLDICQAMISSGIKPDFITIDGGEGGTGAAPVEFTNIIGMPLRDALVFVHDTLTAYNLKKDITLIASGKIFSGFHMARILALGADICNSARGMMLAMGCIQSLQCNKNTCPSGIATQDKSLMNGLVVSNKSQRVANFQAATINSLLEMLAASGITEHEYLNRSHFNRRINANTVLRYDELYPYPEQGSLLPNSTSQD